MSTPVHYFGSLAQATTVELRGHLSSDSDDEAQQESWDKYVSEASCLIIGGGGLLGIDYFAQSLERIFELKNKSCRTVLWGAGHNNWQIGDWRLLKFRINLEQLPFDLVGVRDFNQAYQWVPCASCMHPAFDAAREVNDRRKIGLFVHEGTLNSPDLRQSLPDIDDCISNDMDFISIIDFLSTSELVLTDSYHGMFWATLLGKRVVAFPSSSKFYDTAFPVPLCDPQDWQRFAPLAISYPDALSICREANLNFERSFRNMYFG